MVLDFFFDFMGLGYEGVMKMMKKRNEEDEEMKK